MYPPHPLNQSNAKTSRDLDPRACARWSHSRIYLGSYLLFGVFSFDLINQRNYLGFGFFDAKMLKIKKKRLSHLNSPKALPLLRSGYRAEKVLAES